MSGEYILSLDPYNFESEEEFIKFYYPELSQEKGVKNGEIIDEITRQEQTCGANCFVLQKRQDKRYHC